MIHLRYFKNPETNASEFSKKKSILVIRFIRSCINNAMDIF